MGVLDPVPTPFARIVSVSKRIRGRDFPGASGIPALNTSLGTVTVGTANAATAIPGSVLIKPNKVQFRPWGVDPVYGSTFPESNGWVAGSYVRNSAPPYAVEFDFDSVDGQFEVSTKGTGGSLRFIVNGQLIAAPATLPNNGSGFLVQVALAAGAGQYRVRIEGTSGWRFWGINAMPLSGVTATPRRSKRYAGLGDSFWEPTISETSLAGPGLYGLPQQIGYLTGWEVLPAGSGGTGLVHAFSTINSGATAGTYTFTYGGRTTGSLAFNAGPATVQTALEALSSIGVGNVNVSGSANALSIYLTNTLAGSPFDATIDTTGLTGGTATNTIRYKYRDRLSEVLALTDLDGVLIGMSSNDSPHTAAQVLAELQAVVVALRAAGFTEYGQIIVVGLWWKGGGESIPSMNLAQNDTARDWCATQGLLFIDQYTPPGGIGAVSTTFSSAASSGVSTISTVARFTLGSWIKIGPVGTATLRKVTNVTGTGPYAISFTGATQSAFAVGDPVVEVGESEMTSGNAASYTGPDSTHPTSRGAMFRAKRIVGRMLNIIEH